MSLPALLSNGFLPPGIHGATLPDIIAQFGTGSPRRQELGTRLQELLRVARSTGALRHAFMLDELHSWLSVYQLSRDMIERGIVEVIFGDRDDGSI